MATIAGLIFGIWGDWPYLVEEHRRLRVWQWLPMWLGDLSALFWFISAIVSPSNPSRYGGEAGTNSERYQRRRAFLVSMTLAIAMDFAHTAHLHWQEYADFKSAEVAKGEVTSVQIYEGHDTTRYYVRVRFRDKANRINGEEVRVQRHNAEGLPANARAALANGQVPIPVRVSFDPGLPSRCWLTDAGYQDGDRVYLMSYLVLCCQIMSMCLFAVLLRESHRRGEDPWWEVFQRPLPLMVTSACMFVFGLIEWIGGNLRP
ncbi:hypothetical protein [Aquisphaera insulae]|uniref:hypothetical protein n=1 Tax=Aquisphaera insulae TaxID=2712864 RepID=UPI0013E9F665|nr:hypothetical protein [Aquisphaera insulae]